MFCLKLLSTLYTIFSVFINFGLIFVCNEEFLYFSSFGWKIIKSSIFIIYPGLLYLSLNIIFSLFTVAWPIIPVAETKNSLLLKIFLLSCYSLFPLVHLYLKVLQMVAKSLMNTVESMNKRVYLSVRKPVDSRENILEKLPERFHNLIQYYKKRRYEIIGETQLFVVMKK